MLLYRQDLVVHAFYGASDPAAIMQRLAHYRVDDARELCRAGVGLTPIGDHVVISLMTCPADYRKVRGSLDEQPELPVYIQEPERLVLRQWLRELFAPHLAFGRYGYHREPLEPFLHALRTTPKPPAPPPVPDIGLMTTEPAPNATYLRKAQQERAIRTARGETAIVPVSPTHKPPRPQADWTAADSALIQRVLRGEV